MVAHYFRSKDQMMLAALRLILERMEQRLLRRDYPGDDLLEVLSESLPIDRLRREECAFWTAFWGMIPASPGVRRLNVGVHREYVSLFERCIATHWQEWKRWPKALRMQVLGSIMTLINGLTASAVTSPADWPAKRQLEQLGLQLRLLRNWANGVS
jgi:AcrR family transcriptional regulator